MRWEPYKKRLLAYACFLYVGAALSGAFAASMFASAMNSDTQVLLVVLLGPPVAFGSIVAGLVGVVTTALTREDRVLLILSALTLGLPLAYWYFESSKVSGPLTADTSVAVGALAILVISMWRVVELIRERRRGRVA